MLLLTQIRRSPVAPGSTIRNLRCYQRRTGRQPLRRNRSAAARDFEGSLSLVAIDYADLRFAPLPAFTKAMPPLEVAAFWTDFFPSAADLSLCTLLRRASMRLMTLADF